MGPHHRTTAPSGGSGLAFSNVELAVSGHGSASAAWVAVQATAIAFAGDTNLTFQVGGRTSSSTPIHVVDHQAGGPWDSLTLTFCLATVPSAFASGRTPG
ncbi:hypothetical protein JK364_52130 [Streptomyces sp. 110]|uniref:Uncharacterized protein n=1 Tax=Streptomyces endocoffeicus TaxID=2898945 RepID=A0ABS1Q7U9_9ACTN|nr:hypothetical protein [Streptomyces endocoffeicus]MBL1120753.1 hypothetical protein [Streptomyces endocoffeicus]